MTDLPPGPFIALLYNYIMVCSLQMPITDEMSSSNILPDEGNVEITFQSIVDLEQDIVGSQQSLEEVPDFLNSSYESLQKLAAMSNQDSLIFGDN